MTRASRPQCAQQITKGWHTWRCTNYAKVERNGQHYCGVHDPAKREARLAKEQADRDAYLQTEAGIREEGKRILDRLGPSTKTTQG